MKRAPGTDLSRRGVLAGLGAALLAGAGLAHAKPSVPLEVWKDPNCGCCEDWMKHLEANGFTVRVHDDGNNAVRARLGIDRKYASCHTAVVGGYAIEGHVPAAQIERLLREKPKARGLAVPGMPVGAPGMDGAVYEGRKDPFDVLLLAHDGSATVYQHFEGKKR
jgi:hypothetical protein